MYTVATRAKIYYKMNEKVLNHIESAISLGQEYPGT